MNGEKESLRKQTLEKARSQIELWKDFRATSAVCALALAAVALVSFPRNKALSAGSAVGDLAMIVIAAKSHRKTKRWERFAYHFEQLALSEAGSTKAFSEGEQLDAVCKSIDPKHKSFFK